MKKLIAILLTLIMALSLLTACGQPEGTGSGNGENDSDNNKINAEAPLIQWLLGGTCSFDGTVSMLGYEVSLSVAIDGDMQATAIEGMVAGINITQRSIIRDGIRYNISDINKTISETPQEPGDKSGFFITEKVGEGTGEVNGKELPYVDYSTARGDILRLYLENKAVYAIETELYGDTAVIIINKTAGSVPAGVFDPPAGYTQVDP